MYEFSASAPIRYAFSIAHDGPTDAAANSGIIANDGVVTNDGPANDGTVTNDGPAYDGIIANDGTVAYDGTVANDATTHIRSTGGIQLRPLRS